MVACPMNQEFRGNHWDTVCELRLCIPPVVRSKDCKVRMGLQSY